MDGEIRLDASQLFRKGDRRAPKRDFRTMKRVVFALAAAGTVGATALAAERASATRRGLEPAFEQTVRPFLENYCLTCHDADTRKGDLDLSPFKTVETVAADYAHWELVLERLRSGDMPPKKSREQPAPAARQGVIAWIESLRDREARRNAGDPGPLPARRLSNAEYNHTIHDLTGVDIRPTRTFPVDPANQAGFDNSGESLALSPALVSKYLAAAQEVAAHLALQPNGFTFAPHPVVADTDRDKWAVFRIVDFYRRQPTDFAEYFLAAWRYQHRAALGHRSATLPEVAVELKLSPKYLGHVWSLLTNRADDYGPLAKLRAQWRALPAPANGVAPDVRPACGALRDYVLRVREGIIPAVPNLQAPTIHDGSPTLVLWKDRQMAANRRRFDPAALRIEGSSTNPPASAAVAATPPASKTNAPSRRPPGHVQAPTPEAVKKGGLSLAPTLITRESSATARMAAARKHRDDPELIVPADPVERAHYAAAFARFADIFPDAFYITERGRVYLDAEKEQENAGRLLSAGFHSMTGYFRDDQPLYDLILDAAGRQELDRLWDEFNCLASVPQRMHTSLVWFERTDSAYLRDPEFDPYRPEDKSVTTPEKIRGLAELYLAKARRNNASETAQKAIQEHFVTAAADIARVEQLRAAAEPTHLATLEAFAARAYRRPLSVAEVADLRTFYRESSEANAMNHEEAMRDCVARVLMSPGFLFRMDLVAGTATPSRARTSVRSHVNPPEHRAVQPLPDQALASRLSYFLWASAPDEALRARAAAGDLHRPNVLRSEARRLLQDPRVQNFAAEFAGNWLDFRRFEEHNSVDRERFPVFNNELRQAMFEEPLRFFVDVAQRNRSVLDFLDAPDTFVNAPLARHYGMTPVPPSTNTWVHVENARAYGRGGVLPMAAFLTANSPGLRTSPVKRGYWVVRRVLGERIPPPPAQVPELPRDEKALGDRTLRQALAAHRDRVGCAECHARFDSLGLVFEGYGPVGERRDVDLAGHPVDTQAEFPGGSEGAGLPGLITYIRQHRQPDFVDNLCRKMLAYGLGRTLILGDEPLVREMQAKLRADGYRFNSLVESIVTSPQFLNKRSPETVAKN